MSTIVLPEFVTRPSLQKPLEEASNFTGSRGTDEGRGAATAPRYRIHYAESKRRAAAGQPAQPAVHGAMRVVPAQKPASEPAQPHRNQVNRAPQSPQLTRRGRFVFRGLPLLMVLSLVLLGAISLILPDSAQGAAGEGHSAGSSVVTVLHGDSLWSIAQQAAPERDTRDVVHHIMELNGLKGGNLRPGQQIQVPVYTAK